MTETMNPQLTTSTTPGSFGWDYRVTKKWGRIVAVHGSFCSGCSATRGICGSATKQAIEKETALVDSLKEELTGLLAVIDNMSISEITNLRDSLRNGDGWFGSSQDW
jgi:hypothetical protein